jgi:2-polyprenyl-6-methoxyphenol hydroxylase-like FAD-dependent oxidoreductase
MGAVDSDARPFGRAMVIGGSFAGLLAARVLSDYFNEVMVLERDRLPEGPQSRPGVPQDRQVHTLLQRGAVIMGRLFPGFDADVEAAGGRRIDLLGDSIVRFRGKWMPRYQCGKTTYACSRVLLETVVRRRVAALPNVELAGGARVDGLIESEGRVKGVRVYWKEREASSEEAADLVVDASGRGSKTPDWLAALGYGQVAETVIDAKVGYTGRRCQLDADTGWAFMSLFPQHPNEGRFGLIYGEENGIYMVSLGGMMGDYPPTDEEGFMAFAASLHPSFAEVARAARPVAGTTGYRRLENRMMHYEKLPRWPERFIVVGDAVCGFNPMYAQGMSVAAMAAEALGASVAKSAGKLDGFAPGFQRSYPKIVAPAWLLATSADLEWLGQPGKPTAQERVANWYLPKVLDAMMSDRTVLEAFLEVQNLMQPATSLFNPAIAVRVFRHGLRGKKAVATPVAEATSA